MLGIWTLVPLELVLRLVVWLVVSIVTIQLSTLANCLLVLLLQQSFDCEWVEELHLLDFRLVVRAFFSTTLAYPKWLYVSLKANIY